MPTLGSRQMREISRELAAAPKKMRGRLRRNITAAVQPMKTEVQRNARAIPAHGPASTGLREALANATRVSVSAGTRNVAVRLMVDGKKMPAGQQMLPQYMEGDAAWRHPVYGDDGTWVQQQSHPYFAPAIPPHLPGVAAGVNAALGQTAADLAKG